jgi:hypothetical protein
MKARCLNPDDKSYPDYGGKGIIVCERWLAFENFYADMSDRPEGMTLNRINGAMCYSKETCEWASLTLQAYDKPKQSNNTSGRTGVYWRKDRGVWMAKIFKEGRRVHIGSFATVEDASAAREKAEKEFYGFTKE